MKTLYKAFKILGITIGFLLLFLILFYGHRDLPLKDLKAKYAPSPSAFIGVNGMEVHYREEGKLNDSIPIVLIHGTGSSLHTFEAWTKVLKKDYRVIGLDLPAYGLTGPFPNREYSMEHYVEFIGAFLTALGIEKCILGGNSLGGGIAWRFASQYPKRVERLILIDASGYPSQAMSTPLAFKIAQFPLLKNLFTFITPRFVAKASVENVYADKNLVTESLVDRYFELTLRKGNRQAFIDRLSLKVSENSHKKIKAIQQPTLVLWGDQDQLIPLANAYKFHRDLPNDTLVVLKNTGHVPMEERPNKSVAAVLAFLKGKK